jgi:hypothetical protein
MVHAAQQIADSSCQSCGMPMHADADFGTSSDGSRSVDYCKYCFVDGRFTEPAITMQAMVDKCAEVLAHQGGMSGPQARALMAETIPRLKRWA